MIHTKLLILHLSWKQERVTSECTMDQVNFWTHGNFHMCVLCTSLAFSVHEERSYTPFSSHFIVGGGSLERQLMNSPKWWFIYAYSICITSEEEKRNLQSCHTGPKGTKVTWQNATCHIATVCIYTDLKLYSVQMARNCFFTVSGHFSRDWKDLLSIVLENMYDEIPEFV